MVINYTSIEGNKQWFWGYAFFSDWRNKQCDYATNKVVCDYYNGGDVKWYRINKFLDYKPLSKFTLPPEIIEKLNYGAEVKIGLDVYALYGVSYPLVPPVVLEQIAEDLQYDSVYILHLKKEGNNTQWALTK